MRHGVLLVALLLVAACATGGEPTLSSQGQGSTQPDDLLIVYCQLPPRLVHLGAKAHYLVPGASSKTSAHDCKIRGGMYSESPLMLWLAKAEGGDVTAQAYVAEIFERGVGVPPDYKQAASWYERAYTGGSKDKATASEKASAKAAANALGALYEKGLGVPKDAAQAMVWYGRASGSDVDIVAQGISKPDGDGPEIVLIQPPEFIVATRDIVVTPNSKTLRVPPNATDLTVEGRVTARAGVSSFTINGRETKLDANLFKTQLPIRRAEERVHMVAVDRAGRKNTLDFVILRRDDTPPSRTLPPPSPPPITAFGRYHAFVVGNNDYSKMPRLKTAVNDARAVAEVLQKDYGFSVTLLIDAGRAPILNGLEKLRMQLTEKDNLLIYYAGHGWQDPATGRGYWVPVDAEEHYRTQMISNVDISDIVATMKVKQLLVVADSCFSGVLVGHIRAGRLATGREEELVQQLATKNSRMVMTSASLEPAIDGTGPHSIFAGPFIQLLRGNAGMLAGQEMFTQLYPKVVLTATKFNMSQTPEYGALTTNGGDDKAGHQGGDFVFVKVKAN
jgi:hypothetical protein